MCSIYIYIYIYETIITGSICCKNQQINEYCPDETRNLYLFVRVQKFICKNITVDRRFQLDWKNQKLFWNSAREI